MNYYIERSTNLSAVPCFSVLATNLPGSLATTTFTDTNAALLAPVFYRITR